MNADKNERLVVVMSPTIIKAIKKRTQDSQRTVNKEIVWIVQQFLNQEQRRNHE